MPISAEPDEELDLALDAVIRMYQQLLALTEWRAAATPWASPIYPVLQQKALCKLALTHLLAVKAMPRN